MKRIVVVGLAMVLACGAAWGKELDVLMIGNSFSVCVGTYLPHIVNRAPGHALRLTSAYIGGCPLDRHWKNIEESEADASKKQYGVTVWDSREPAKKKTGPDSINALIKKGGWDIITIQQASPKSWDYATYQPYADNLIAYIKRHAPDAEIVIQQTWSYNIADGRIKGPGQGGWGFDQTGMFERVAAAYGELAGRTGFRQIPVGRAVQHVRALGPLPVPGKDGAEAVTGGAADVVGAPQDTIHLNTRGEYLQACVWFAVLFGEPAGSVAFTPAGMDAGYAAALRACAEKAVDQK